MRDDVYWIMHYVNWGFGNINYVGHYIVLSGYDESTKKFKVHDPAGYCYWVSETVLNEARKSYGTDEDMIVVYK